MPRVGDGARAFIVKIRLIPQICTSPMQLLWLPNHWAIDNFAGVGHLLLPDAMPTLSAVHLLPCRIRNRARCHLLPAAGFFYSGSGIAADAWDRDQHRTRLLIRGSMSFAAIAATCRAESCHTCHSHRFAGGPILPHDQQTAPRRHCCCGGPARETRDGTSQWDETSPGGAARNRNATDRFAACETIWP